MAAMSSREPARVMMVMIRGVLNSSLMVMSSTILSEVMLTMPSSSSLSFFSFRSVRTSSESKGKCRTTRTAQWWELGLQAIRITVHKSLLASNTRWAVEQKLSKKEMFLLAVLHSSQVLGSFR